MLERLHGALIIDKPEGISSFGVIARLQRALAEQSGISKKKRPSEDRPWRNA